MPYRNPKTGEIISDAEFNKINNQEDVDLSPLGITLKTLGSMPSSTFNYAKRILTAFNPLNTIKNLSQIPGEFQALKRESGGTSKAIKATAKEIPSTLYKGVIPKFVQEIQKGDFEKAGLTIANDPVGQIAPLILTAKWAADKAGMTSQFDKAMSTIASPVTKPLEFAAQKTGQLASSLGSKGLEFTTGKGEQMIKEAYNRNPEFTEALKGRTTPTSIIDKAQDAISRISEKRGKQYETDLANLPKTGKLNFSSIQNKLNTQLEKFGIGVDKNGKLNFSKSPIRNDSSAVRDIKTVFEDISSQTDLSPTGLDILKKNLDILYSPTSRARAFVQAIRDEVNTTIKTQVPEYAEMTGKYTQTSELLKDMKALSLSGKSNPDTIMNKLISAMKSDNEVKTELFNILQKEGESNLASSVAGLEMKNWLPSSFIGKSALASIPFFGLTPSDFLILAITSPKIVAEFVGLLGMTAKQTFNFTSMMENYKNVFLPTGVVNIQKK
ncbi:MAG: hypothetical protein ABH824_00475 [Nanoarchaeota archaeon]